MLGKLKGLTASSPIADVPEVINENNAVLEKEFGLFFDSSTASLTRSLRAPQGDVEAHNGKFVNLRVSNLILDSSAATTNLGKELAALAAGEVEHSSLRNRFSTDSASVVESHDTPTIVTVIPDGEEKVFCGARWTGKVTLRDELDRIETVVSGLAENLSVKGDGDNLYDGGGKDDFDSPSISALYKNASDVNGRLSDIERRLSRIESRLGLNKTVM